MYVEALRVTKEKTSPKSDSFYPRSLKFARAMWLRSFVV